MSEVTKRLDIRRLKKRRQAEKVMSADYAPEMQVPERELKAIGTIIVKMTMSDKTPDLTVLKALVANCQVAMRQCKAKSRMDEREFEAAVEGYLWEQGISESIRGTYAAMGYPLTNTSKGSKFQKAVK